MDYEDELISCRGCGAEFTFTASDKHFYYDVMKFLSKPKRCVDCRKLAARNRALQTSEMQTRGQHGDG